ncbi:MAG: phenylalanine--tRNA ligase subunit beta, partial [Nitrospira sp.]|nr:phenylalanine--tRNA ligase subunit beta [Nitrospira sp.]
NRIKTLDGTERDLPEDTLLIWDGERPIAVAGVMGGAETEVLGWTKNIFLESAYFEPFSIRRTSKRLSLVSESSYRFERGTDIEFLVTALDRAALLIQELAGGVIHKIIDAYPVKYVAEPVEINYGRINRFLGTELSKREILEILEGLGIPTEDRGDIAILYPPSFRRDIKSDSDVAEEISRMYGYDRIPSKIPRSPLPTGRKYERTVYVVMVRESMRKSGFTEVVNFSFMNPASLDLIDIPESDRRRRAIVIKNPLRQEESLLRTTLMPSLIENFTYNLDRGMEHIRLFEISRIFEDTGKPLPLEELRLGGVFYREKVSTLWKDEVQGFYIAKGALESLFDELKIRNYSFEPSTEPFLHRGKASDIYITNSRVGFIGVLGPHIVERLNLKKHKPEIVLFEINLDLLLTLTPESIQYSPIPRYPSIERDMAIIVDETTLAAQVKEMIKAFPSELIEEVSIFDSYKGGVIPKGKKSLGFSIVYRSSEKTLTDKEVEELHASLVKHILEKTGGELRK